MQCTIIKKLENKYKVYPKVLWKGNIVAGREDSFIIDDIIYPLYNIYSSCISSTHSTYTGGISGNIASKRLLLSG